MTTISTSSFNTRILPFYVPSSLNSSLAQNMFTKKLHLPRLNSKSYAHTSLRAMGTTGFGVPEIPTAPPARDPAVPPEMPQMPNTPDFDPVPPEQPSDPPPLSPGPNPGPEFPGTPNPKPEIPLPPGQPEVKPPHGPEVIPPYTPEPDMPTPTMMGSDGLVFY